MWIGSELNPLCTSANEESGPLVNNALLTDEKKRSRKNIQGNWCDPLQDQKSDILKRVDKRMCQLQLDAACGRINSKHTVKRENILTPIAQGDLLRQHQN